MGAAESITTGRLRCDGDAVLRNRPVRIMLVDDSVVARAIIENIIERDDNFEVIASVSSATEALSALAHAAPEIVILDIEMPGMSGITALPMILDKSRGARVLILSANCAAGGPAAVEALAHGADDTLIKPGRGTFAGSFATTLIERLHALSTIDRAGDARSDDHRPARLKAIGAFPKLPPASNAADRRDGEVSAIGIGASTGGIMAINAFLGALPRDLVCPIFITQHLPSNFMPFFAEQLHRLIGRTVFVGEDGMRVAPECIYLAPGDGHLALSYVNGTTRIVIDRSAAASGAMPSVDPMLASMADVYGEKACGVMLSGMGSDGLSGARRLRVSGGLILAQDIESSVVWGMPGAVAREGIAHAVQNPLALAAIVASAGLRASGVGR
ncbi:MAG: chemotaxis protein CheB [Sphingopyxis sp.]